MRLAYRLLLFAALFALLPSRPVEAQKSQPRLYVLTYIDVYPNFAADTSKALLQFSSESRKDTGSVRFEVMHDVERMNHFAVVEVWQSRQAYEKHLTQPYAKQFRDKIQPWLGSPFDERLYNMAE